MMKLFVTGANRGLGLHVTKLALEGGHHVIAGVRQAQLEADELRELKERYPIHLMVVPLDVKNEQSVQAASEHVRQSLGQVDAIVNNAAILVARDQKLEQLSLEQLEETFQVNLYGPIRVAKHFLPLMVGNGEKAIINISSEAGSFANAYGGDYPYALSKGALNLFSEHVRRYVADRSIRVYAVHPGWIRTDMGGNEAPGDPYEAARGVLALVDGSNCPNDAGVFINSRGEPMDL